MVVTQLPAALFIRCPGCARALEAGRPGCAHCKLAVAGGQALWTQNRIETEKLRPHTRAGAAALLAATAASAFLLLEPGQSAAMTSAVLIFVLWCGALAGLCLSAWARVVLEKVRHVSSWTFITEWSSDVNAGYVHTTVLLVGDRLAHARGHLSEHSQPSARQFGSQAAPLSSQRRFVRWLTCETVLGRARVADERTIEWEINGPEPRRGIFVRVATQTEPVRTEMRRLMVAAAPADPPTETGTSVTPTVYSEHLGKPRPVSELWVALSREADKLPEGGVADYELPDWAHELEAAITAEVSSLVVN